MRSLIRRIIPLAWRGAILAAGVLALLLGGCDDGELGGTMTASYDLTFDSVRAYWTDGKLVIAYERPYNGSVESLSYGDPIYNQVVRVEINSDREALEAGSEVLFNRTETDFPPITIEHYVLNEALDERIQQEDAFPELSSAHVSLDEVSVDVDEAVKGEFECEFIDDRTLWGEFDATVTYP